MHFVSFDYSESVFVKHADSAWVPKDICYLLGPVKYTGTTSAVFANLYCYASANSCIIAFSVDSQHLAAKQTQVRQNCFTRSESSLT